MTKEEERATQLAEHDIRLANLERIITAMTAAALAPKPEPQGKKHGRLTVV